MGVGQRREEGGRTVLLCCLRPRLLLGRSTTEGHRGLWLGRPLLTRRTNSCPSPLAPPMTTTSLSTSCLTTPSNIQQQRHARPSSSTCPHWQTIPAQPQRQRRRAQSGGRCRKSLTATTRTVTSYLSRRSVAQARTRHPSPSTQALQPALLPRQQRRTTSPADQRGSPSRLLQVTSVRRLSNWVG